MLITVAVATYNRPTLLLEALDSIAAQTYGSWEVVVVDDGSQPPVERAVIEAHLGARYTLVRHDVGRGVAEAKNAGVHAASGEIILHLDDDDLLEPEALERIAAHFANHPELDCVFLNTRPFGRFAQGVEENQQKALARLIAQAAESEDDELTYFGTHAFEALLKSVPLPMQRPAARRGAWNIVGYLTTGLLFSEPDWTIRASLHCRMALTKVRLSRWRVDGQNFASRPEALGDALDNGVAAARKLRDQFDAESRQAALRVRKLNERLAQAYFDKAYYIWDRHGRTDWHSIMCALRISPSWRPIRFVIRNFALKLGLKRPSAAQ